jgi:hypothetical protein
MGAAPAMLVETLVVSGTLDFAAPAQNATRELMPHLPSGHQLILREFGHSGDFRTEQTRAGAPDQHLPGRSTSTALSTSGRR